MKTNDVYTAYISWKNGGKRRPVLIVNSNNEEIQVFKITTKYENKSQQIKKKYYKIQNLSSAGLLKPSYIDTIKTYSLSSTKINFKRIGKLSLEDIRELDKFINSSNSEIN